LRILLRFLGTTTEKPMGIPGEVAKEKKNETKRKTNTARYPHILNFSRFTGKVHTNF
jgi:hypothetical protein